MISNFGSLQQTTIKKTPLDGLLVAEILFDVEVLLGRQSLANLDLEALETAVRRQALHLAGRAVEQRLNADHSDSLDSNLLCPCGQMARYAGRRAKMFTSVLGPLKLVRAYFHCAACGHGFCPRDRRMGVDHTALSPGVTRMVGSVGAMVSFEEGSQLLTELAGLAVDEKQNISATAIHIISRLGWDGYSHAAIRIKGPHWQTTGWIG